MSHPPLTSEHLQAIRRALWCRRILLLRESSSTHPRHLPATRRELQKEIQEIQELNSLIAGELRERR